MTTWTPFDGAIVFDPEKGQRYVYRNGEWQPIPEWKDEPSPLDDRRAPHEPITVAALEAAGWNKKNHDDLGTLHIYRLGRMSIEVYLSVYGVYSESTSINIYVVDALGNDDREHRIRLPGVQTMQQLAALAEMLGG